MKGFIIYPTYETIEDETSIYLYGKLENGESFVTINKFQPYLFVKTSEMKKISKYLKDYKVQNLDWTNFEGEKVTKISSKNQTQLNKLYQVIHKTVDTYESDIRPQYRFIMDNDLLGSMEISGEHESSEKIDRVYKEPKISKTEFHPKLKIVSVDIESDKNGGLFCIGIYAENFKKNFMITNHDLKNVIKCKNETEVLLKFAQEILKLDPDIITGWNLIDFDLKYLQELYKKNKIPFDIARNNDSPRLRIESNFFRASSADVTGRQVIDALSLIKDPFIQEAPSIKFANFETYTLEDVSQAILGKGKLMKGKGRHVEIEDLYKKNTKETHQKLADYNLLDCELVYEILEKTKMIDLAVERSQLTGMPIDRITASIAAFDSLYIREAHAKGIVSPTTHFSQKEEKIKGGYVMESNPGIYHNILVLDFKSLYPSVLKTFNIDPASFLEKPEKNAIESPNHAYFKNQDGVLPKIITKLHDARERAKKEKRELSSYAIKIIMNSFWGVLASPNCRYFNFEMASAITGFARFIIQLTAKEIEKFGYKTIYSDTDSVFIETGLKKTDAEKLGKKIEEHINSFYKEYVKKNYNRESSLELQFQKLYLAFMMPQIRGEIVKGAKKRYAGLIEKNGKEEVEIVGLEAIRGDWVEAAQDFQRALLDKVFHNEKIEQFIKEYIKKIKEGKLDSKLVYKKSIRKELVEYTKTTPPHVKAARQLDSLDSNIIQYYITTEGPEPIQKLRHKIDYDHYIKKQIEPIANQVLILLNKDFEEVIKKSKQTTLA